MAVSNKISEQKSDRDPSLLKLKSAIKIFAQAATDASKSTEGKELPATYWIDVLRLVRKAKLGISMIDLGIEDPSDFKDMVDPSDNDLKKTGPVTKMDDTDPTTSDKSEPSSSEPAEPKDQKPPAKSDDETDGEDEEEDEDEVNEVAQSKSQQRLFGMVHAYNKGELDKSDVDSELYAKIKKIASGMNKKDTKDIAKTDHDDLPEKVPTDEYYDILNHMKILLSEQNFDSVETNGTKFSIATNNRKFTIKFDDKFYMVSENYNFDLGTTTDLQRVVNTFLKLSNHSESRLIDDYKTSID